MVELKGSLLNGKFMGGGGYLSCDQNPVSLCIKFFHNSQVPKCIDLLWKFGMNKSMGDCDFCVLPDKEIRIKTIL